FTKEHTHDSMDRLQKLLNVWNWLPAFRTVAEVENLPAASKKLSISASALSRTVRLLEEELGHPLFDRVGRRLVLNSKGAALLGSVRRSMRIVSDALDEVTSSVMSGAVHIASPGSFMPIFVLPALRLLKKRHPGLRPVLGSVNADDIRSRVTTGALDLVLTDQQIQVDEDMLAELLFDVNYSVYCGAGHPLYEYEDESIEPSVIVEHEFAAPPNNGDHWPNHISRVVGVQTLILSTGVDLCGSGDFLAVLPDVVAELPRHFAALRRLPFHVCAPVPMYAIYRRALSSARPTEAVLKALRDSLPGAPPTLS
ncbi:MAG: LysR family transcriptional regulator, partial [Myxococcota bacterium]